MHGRNDLFELVTGTHWVSQLENLSYIDDRNSDRDVRSTVVGLVCTSLPVPDSSKIIYICIIFKLITMCTCYI